MTRNFIDFVLLTNLATFFGLVPVGAAVLSRVLGLSTSARTEAVTLSRSVTLVAELSFSSDLGLTGLTGGVERVTKEAISDSDLGLRTQKVKVKLDKTSTSKIRSEKYYDN